jgi:hypothetical protein
MAVRIKLIDGEELLIDVDLAEWNRAFRRALKADAMLEIENAEGGILGINPHQVLYLEEASAEELAAEEDRQPEPAGA